MKSTADLAQKSNADLELIIGSPPNEPMRESLEAMGSIDRVLAARERKTALCEYLIRLGIPRDGDNSVAKASTVSLKKAYENERYRAGWLRNVREGKRPRPGQGIAHIESETDAELEAELDGLDDDFDRIAKVTQQSQPKADLFAEDPAASQAPAPAGGGTRETPSPITATHEAIARAAEQVITKALTDAERRLGAQIARIAKTELDDARQALRAELQGDIASAVRAAVEALAPPRRLEILDANANLALDLGVQHFKFPTLLRAVQARNHNGQRLNVWLTGPTGSGKTTGAEQVALALSSTFKSYRKKNDSTWEILNADGSLADLNGLSHDAPFGADSSLDSDYKVVGFKDANGTFHWTTFLRIFVFGGVYVADEIDNWMPSALVALNAALANGWISTPIGLLRRHPDCCIIGAANTWGLGATSDYVGRSKLDQATLNRFVTKIDWPYDEKLEREIARQMGGTAWLTLVLEARKQARDRGLKIIISPRNTFDGIANLKAGFTVSEAVEMCLTAGLKPEQIEALNLRAAIAHATAELETQDLGAVA